jgi:hypothetical protein
VFALEWALDPSAVERARTLAAQSCEELSDEMMRGREPPQVFYDGKFP